MNLEQKLIEMDSNCASDEALTIAYLVRALRVAIKQRDAWIIDYGSGELTSIMEEKNADILAALEGK